MFERRLKILLGILVMLTALVLLRAAHVQIVNGEHWRRQAINSMKRSQLVDTVRGRILDRMSDVNFKRWTRWIVTAVGAIYLVQAAQLFLASA
jgi:cell division protein FtsI/penicillin-binding protein 2